jgi:hypothetical protein
MATVKISDLSGATEDVSPVKVNYAGKAYEIDLTTEESAAFLALFADKNHGPLTALMALYAPTPAAPVKATRNRSKTGTGPAADSDELASVKNWLATNGHANSTIREWAHGNGFPEVEPGKPGRLAGAPVIAYARAHGYTDGNRPPVPPVKLAPAPAGQAAANAALAANAATQTGPSAPAPAPAASKTAKTGAKATAAV